MFQLIFLLALAYGTQGCTENVKVTTTWYQPPTPVTQNCAKTHTFTIPSDSYANVKVGITGAAKIEDVALLDDSGTRFDVSGASEEGDSVNFPSTFHVIVEYTIPSSQMKLEITVTTKKRAPLTNVTQITTNANKQPTVIYLKDWAPGTYYTFTSKSSSSKVAVFVDPHITSQSIVEQSLLNNVFITEGGVNKGTITPYIPTGTSKCVSKGNEITLYLAESANLLGAILVTDYDNVKPFSSYGVQYVPVGSGGNPTGYATLDGDYSKPIPGAITIIGEKNGATPITVRSLDNYGSGANFTYVSGGPVVNFGVVAAPLTSNMLPRTLSGSLNTFIVSQGHALVKYSI